MFKKLLIGLLVGASASAAQAVPSCWPSQVSGAGSSAIFGETATMRYTGWTCPDPTDSTKKTAVVIVARKSSAFYNPGVTGKSLKDVAVAYWNANVKADLSASMFTEAKTATYKALNFTPAGTAPAIKSLMVRKDMVNAIPVYRPEDIIIPPPDNNPIMEYNPGKSDLF